MNSSSSGQPLPFDSDESEAASPNAEIHDCRGPLGCVVFEFGADLARAGVEVGGIARIDSAEFDAVPGATFDPHAVVGGEGGSFVADLFEQWRAGSVLERHYPNATYDVDGPVGSGVTVLFVEAEDQFFLLEDHMAGHLDNPIGPFRGDPREQLVDAVGT